MSKRDDESIIDETADLQTENAEYVNEMDKDERSSDLTVEVDTEEADATEVDFEEVGVEEMNSDEVNSGEVAMMEDAVGEEIAGEAFAEGADSADSAPMEESMPEGPIGAAVAAGLMEKKGTKTGRKGKKPLTKSQERLAAAFAGVKSFNLKGFSKGMRGKITILAIVVSMIPMLVLTGLNLASQSRVIQGNIGELNTAVNNGLIQRVDANVAALIKTMELVPETSDLMVLTPVDQERVLRKILSSDSLSFRDVTLTDKGGMVLSATDSKNSGQSKASEKWFIETMKGKPYISDVYKDKSNFPVFDIAVPVLDTSKNPNGVLVAKIALDKIQKIIKETKVGENGIAYIVDQKGVVVAHPEFKKMVIEAYNTVENKIEGPSKISKGEEGQSTYKNSDGKSVQGTYYVIPSTKWGLVTEISVDEAMKPVTQARNFSFGLVLVVGLIALVASVYMALVIAAPLVQMVGIAEEIKNGRFNNKIKVKGTDEISKLQESFNEMSESLSSLLRQVDTAVGNITSASVKMTDGTHTASAAVEEITAIVEDVANGAVEQIESVESAVDVVKEITTYVEDAASKTVQVAERANEAATVAQKGSENISIISDKVNGIKENVLSNAVLVQRLGEKSTQVGETVKSIREIAGKTNMLALNAAIEAARAGDAGRGFAVVANEIRNLAEQTRDASKSIESLLLEIQRDSLVTVESMNSGIVEVEAGTEAIANTYGTFNQIIEDVQLVAKEVMEVSASVLNLQQESSKVVEAVMKVESIAQTTSNGTQNILASTEEQASATSEMAMLATGLSEMATDLRNMINRFEFEKDCVVIDREESK